MWFVHSFINSFPVALYWTSSSALNRLLIFYKLLFIRMIKIFLPPFDKCTGCFCAFRKLINLNLFGIINFNSHVPPLNVNVSVTNDSFQLSFAIYSQPLITRKSKWRGEKGGLWDLLYPPYPSIKHSRQMNRNCNKSSEWPTVASSASAQVPLWRTACEEGNSTNNSNLAMNFNWHTSLGITIERQIDGWPEMEPRSGGGGATASVRLHFPVRMGAQLNGSY